MSRIGSTKDKSGKRFKTQVGYAPLPLMLVFTLETEIYKEAETALHRSLRPQKANGDWYRCNPGDILAAAEEHLYGLVRIQYPAPATIFYFMNEVSSVQKGKPFNKKWYKNFKPWNQNIYTEQPTDLNSHLDIV
ncbi:MAG: GIY-YIG nuclease family protein [Sphingobacteriaceae bacterium]|nr:MAG: GIY-YIG nuclease family protein [Sphingobacteriaceae bacterium]